VGYVNSLEGIEDDTTPVKRGLKWKHDLVGSSQRILEALKIFGAKNLPSRKRMEVEISRRVERPATHGYFFRK